MAGSALHEALILLGEPRDLSPSQSRSAVTEIIDGQADPVVISAFLTALRIKGEVADELAGAVLAVRDRMTVLEVPPSCRPLLDTCGTGGDGANTVNVSTAAAIVVASCGVRVAKHGNRSASGNSGSAEVLSELGIDIDAAPDRLLRGLEDVGIAFLFAPKFHPALRHAAPIRRQLPFRTLFNLVGPLANPSRPEFQLIGVPDRDKARMIARALVEMGDATGARPRAFVVAGGRGLDEVGLSGPNALERVDGPDDHPVQFWNVEDFGLPEVEPESLRVSGPADSASRIRAMLDGEKGPVRAVVAANAAAALLLVGKAGSLVEGVAIATEAIDRGDASRLLRRWRAASSYEETTP